MAAITVTANVADATALGGDWQRSITLTSTTTAVEIKLDKRVEWLDWQADTAGLKVSIDGTAGVAIGAEAFVYGADQVARRRAPSTTRPYRSLFVQATTNPTVLRLTAYDHKAGL